MGAYPKFEGVAVQAYDKMVSDLRERAKRELGLPDSEIVIRSLRPEDLELSTPQWTFSCATTGSYVLMLATASIYDNTFVGINGVCYANATPTVDQLKIVRAGSDARIWNIQECLGNENKTIWFDDPVTIGQNEVLDVYYYSATATTVAGELICFLGAVAEKRGILVNP